MIKFDIEKLRSVYVNIVKITGDYVYVSSARSGLPYRPTTSAQEVYRGLTVSKIKINRGVSTSFNKIYACSEFPSPRLASLNMYDDDVVSIEIQNTSAWAGGFQNSENWQSFFSRVIPRLQETLEKQNEVWINGKEIFWLLSKDDDRDGYRLDLNGYLHLREVNYVRLSSMGFSTLVAVNSHKELLAKTTGAEIALSTERAVLKVHAGRVMSYRPNAMFPELEFIEAYSPVLSADDPAKVSSRKQRHGLASEERRAYNLINPNNPAYANIDFALRAAHTIGKLYGHEHVDALDIPRIIEQTGCVFLTDIDELSRRKVPVHMTAMYCLALIFGYIYTEKNMNNMRELSYMFRFCIKYGLVYENEINNDFLPNAPSHEIPLESYESFLNAA
jgi:hypothetical protein